MRAATVLAGTVLMAVGVVGLFLPILPGWLLIIPGLALLGREFTWAERLLAAIRSRFESTRSSLAQRRPPAEERDAA